MYITIFLYPFKRQKLSIIYLLLLCNGLSYKSSETFRVDYAVAVNGNFFFARLLFNVIFQIFHYLMGNNLFELLQTFLSLGIACVPETCRKSLEIKYSCVAVVITGDKHVLLAKFTLGTAARRFKGGNGVALREVDRNGGSRHGTLFRPIARFQPLHGIHKRRLVGVPHLAGGIHALVHVVGGAQVN